MKSPTMMKVYCSQWGEPPMPEDVKRAFFELHSDPNPGNDVFVQYSVADCAYEEGNEWSALYKLLDDWLLANGAVVGETVLIKHWW